MSEKGKSILAYIFTWIGGLIVLYGMKDNTRNTKMHAAQAIATDAANQSAAQLSAATAALNNALTTFNAARVPAGDPTALNAKITETVFYIIILFFSLFVEEGSKCVP